MRIQLHERHYPWLLALLGLVFFLPFLGRVHLFDWDEINFAESAREMLVSGNYARVTVGFRPFWEKPPLFFWLQALAMQVFGVNEFAARLPNAIFGIITLITVYAIGRHERDARFGLLWGLLYFGSLLPHMYFKSGIIDPVFNYFIFTGTYFIYRTYQLPARKLRHAAIAGVLIGLAVLTKGPVGLLMPMLTFTVVVALHKFRRWPRVKDVSVFALLVLLVSSAWYGLEMIKNGPWFIKEFIEYQIELFSRPVADHQQPLYYHFVVVLLGCFPMSVLALGSFKKKYVSDELTRWMMTLFWVVMILFTIVTTKIVHYSSMSYLPLSFLAATYLSRKQKAGQSLPGWLRGVYLFIGLLFGTLLTLLPLVYFFKDKLIPYIDDPFAVAGLQKAVAWGGYEFLAGLLFVAGVVLSFFWFGRQRYFKAVSVMALSTALTLMAYMLVVVPKIEAHSQGSLVEFLESLQGKDVYVTTYGFHSYAPFFYFAQPNDNPDKRADKEYLLNGPTDKPVYIITKITDTTLVGRSDLQLLKEEGGYRFYLRQAINSH